VSFIGTLDQFDLSIILQRIESYKKTGLLVVKQGERLVELSFRQGQLLCIGPVRPDISLADRLLQAGVISREAYQEVASTPGVDLYREVGAALTLIDLGHVNQQSLYNWASSEAIRVIEALIAWTDGKIYFEENQQPPNDRLLIALPILSMLPEQPAEAPAEPAAVGAAPSSAVAQSANSAASVTQHSRISDAPTMHGEEPTFFDDTTVMASFSASLFASPGTAPDGLLGREHPHPRAYGTFPRILRKYVREEKKLRLEDAIRKFSALPAQRMRLADRGVLKAGMWADVVIFDPDTISDHATFEQPHQLSSGVRDVWVNGVQVLAGGTHTGASPGEIGRGPGFKWRGISARSGGTGCTRRVE